MQREFLRDLGLEKDTIDQIMAENGKDIQAEQAKQNEVVEQLRSDLEEAQKTIQSLEEVSNNAEDVKREVEEYREKYEAEVAKREESERLSAIEKALIVNQANNKYLDTLAGYIPADVDLDKIDDEVAKIKEEYSELFQVTEAQTQSTGGYKVVDNKLKDGEEVTWTKEKILAIKDDKERQKKIAENLDKFK